MIEAIKTDAFRRSVTEYARRVANGKEPIPIGTTGGRPTYLLVPVPEGQRSEIRCVRIGPDELRRNFPEIRSLIRLEDIPFGLNVDDQLMAILRRHPDYRPAAADEYRALYRRDIEKTGNDTPKKVVVAPVAPRITALEATVTEVSTRLAAIESALATRRPASIGAATEGDEEGPEILGSRRGSGPSSATDRRNRQRRESTRKCLT